MEIFNPLDLDRWRNIVRDFDARRAKFYTTLTAISRPVPDAGLEARRRDLVERAIPIKAELEKVMRGLAGVRDAIRNAGKYFGLSGRDTLGAIFVPIVIGVGIVAVTAVISKVIDWQKDADRWEADAVKISAGWTPEEIARAAAGPKEQPKLFGMDMGALKWAAIIAGVIIAGPYIVQQIEKRT